MQHESLFVVHLITYLWFDRFCFEWASNTCNRWHSWYKLFRCILLPDLLPGLLNNIDARSSVLYPALYFTHCSFVNLIQICHAGKPFHLLSCFNIPNISQKSYSHHQYPILMLSKILRNKLLNLCNIFDCFVWLFLNDGNKRLPVFLTMGSMHGFQPLD